MDRFLLLILAVLLTGFFLPAPASADHQRIGTEELKANRISIQAAVTTAFSPEVSVSSLSGTITPSILAEFGRKYMISIEAPINYYLPLSTEGEKGMQAFFGDPAVSAGIAGRIRNLRYNITLGYTCPLGISDAYHLAAMDAAGGSGYHTLSCSSTAAVILDPVIAGITFGYALGIPAKNNAGNSIEPGQFSLLLRITEILNDRISILAGFSQNVSLPALNSTSPAERKAVYQAMITVRFDVSLKPVTMQFGLQVPVPFFSGQLTLLSEGGYTYEW